MNRPGLLAYALLAVWASWIAGSQGFLVARAGHASWVPDVSFVLLYACAGRFTSADVPRAALLVALARVAFTIEPPSAILAGFLAAALFLRAIRSVAEVDDPLLRMFLAGAGAWTLSAWFALVHVVREGGVDFSAAWLPQWRGAVSTGLFALFCGPLLLHLPGLTPLRKRTW